MSPRPPHSLFYSQLVYHEFPSDFFRPVSGSASPAGPPRTGLIRPGAPDLILGHLLPWRRLREGGCACPERSERPGAEGKQRRGGGYIGRSGGGGVRGVERGKGGGGLVLEGRHIGLPRDLQEISIGRPAEFPLHSVYRSVRVRGLGV